MLEKERVKQDNDKAFRARGEDGFMEPSVCGGVVSGKDEGSSSHQPPPFSGLHLAPAFFSCHMKLQNI